MSEPVVVIEVRQHHFLTGMKRDEVAPYFAQLHATFLASVPPGTKLYGIDRPEWEEKTVHDGDRCPWGYSWFKEGPDGTLELWRADWDSSG